MIWRSDTSVTSFILDDLLDGYHENMRLGTLITFKNYDIHFYLNHFLDQYFPKKSSAGNGHFVAGKFLQTFPGTYTQYLVWRICTIPLYCFNCECIMS